MRKAAGPVALLDANILYSAGFRDILMQLALQGLFRPLWSMLIHDEWMTALQRTRPDIPLERLHYVRDLMDRHAQDALVTGFEHRIESLSLPDPGDRHVLAAAIEGGANMIVTQNVGDFPSEALRPYSIKAIRVDAFLCQLLASNARETLKGICKHRASLKNPTKSQEDYIHLLYSRGLTEFAEKLAPFQDRL